MLVDEAMPVAPDMHAEALRVGCANPQLFVERFLEVQRAKGRRRRPAEWNFTWRGFVRLHAEGCPCKAEVVRELLAGVGKEMP